MSVVCYQVESCALDWSLVQVPTECDGEASVKKRPWPTRGCCAVEGEKKNSELVYAALVFQRTKRMCLTILLPVACLILPYFSTLSSKRHDFGENLLSMNYVF